MDKPTFQRFIIILRSAGLVDTPHISVEEKIITYIQVLLGKTNRDLIGRFQHSGATISKIVTEVSIFMRSINHLFMLPPDISQPLSTIISSNPKFAPFFNECMGALDGTLIPAFVHARYDAAAFRDRKKKHSQNVLGACNFDMTWQYVLAGWEGSAHDSRVYNDAKRKGFPFILGWYHLGDAGYALTKRCLVPYRGVRYHLKVIFYYYYNQSFDYKYYRSGYVEMMRPRQRRSFSIFVILS